MNPRKIIAYGKPSLLSRLKARLKKRSGYIWLKCYVPLPTNISQEEL